MMQVRSDSQGINDFVRKPVGQELVQAAAKLLPAATPLPVVRGGRQKLQLRRTGAPEPRDFQNDSLRGLLGHTHDAPHQALLRTPEMQQRPVALRAHLILRTIECGKPLAVFMHLCRPTGAHTGQSTFEFDSQFHEEAIIEYYILVIRQGISCRSGAPD
jgi:hypothetical protein